MKSNKSKKKKHFTHHVKRAYVSNVQLSILDYYYLYWIFPFIVFSLYFCFSFLNFFSFSYLPKYIIIFLQVLPVRLYKWKRTKCNAHIIIIIIIISKRFDIETNKSQSNWTFDMKLSEKKKKKMEKRREFRNWNDVGKWKTENVLNRIKCVRTSYAELLIFTKVSLKLTITQTPIWCGVLCAEYREIIQYSLKKKTSFEIRIHNIPLLRLQFWNTEEFCFIVFESISS